MACCQSSDNDVLVDHCLQPLLDLKKPGIIMLAGPGLATAQKLADAGWVGVGALPLMLLDRAPASRRDRESDVRSLTEEDLPEARALLADTYSLSDAAAGRRRPPPGRARTRPSGCGVCSTGDRMVSSFTGATEDGLVVVWSMATRRDAQGHGYGRRLLDAALRLPVRSRGRGLAAPVVGGRREALPRARLPGGRVLATVVAAALGDGPRLTA